MRTTARPALLALCLLILGLCAGCRSTPGGPGPAAPVTPEGTAAAETAQIALNWFPEAEHGGYYAALVHGLYGGEGVEVEILGGGPDAPVIPRVASGQVTFGVVNADDVLLGRAQEAPVVALMAPIQDSPRCIIVHEKSGIKRLSDLKNLTLAMSARAPFSNYLRAKLPLPGVEIVPYPGNVGRFLLEDNYAQQGYIFSEPFLIEKEGGDPRSLMVSEMGFNPYTSVLITSEQVIQEQPEMVGRVVQASVHGWARYLEDPQQTHAHIHEINPEMGLDILDYGVAALKPLVLAGEGETGIGRMTSERWDELLSQLEEIDLIKPGAVQAGEAFTTGFLPEPETVEGE